MEQAAGGGVVVTTLISEGSLVRTQLRPRVKERHRARSEARLTSFSLAAGRGLATCWEEFGRSTSRGSPGTGRADRPAVGRASGVRWPRGRPGMPPSLQGAFEFGAHRVGEWAQPPRIPGT